MADAASIGAGNSSYTGNAGIGGGTFGSFQLNTKPIEDLARYTMLYNKAEYDQRQLDAEKAAAEIADYTSYDLTTGIPKDATHLQDKYERLTQFVNNNPDALDYRNKEAWAEYKKLRNELDNDLKGAQIRNTMWKVRQEEIQREKDPARKRLMQEELDKEIADTDIRTPIRHSQQYNDQMPAIPKPNPVKFDIWVKQPNDNVQRKFNFLDMGNLWANSAASALELESIVIDPNTPEGKRRAINKSNDFWQKGAQAFNSVVATAKTPEGGVDTTKMDSTALGVYNLAQKFNEYSATKKAEIKAGVYKDKLGNAVQFDGTFLKEQDYRGVNVNDGISPEELAAIAQFAQWQGDSYETSIQETDDQIQREQLANQRRGQDLDNARFYAGLNKGTTDDIISADAVLKEVSDAVLSGVPKDVVNYIDGKRTVLKSVVTIADPNLLKEFGNIDKDGTTTNVPDAVHFNEKDNKLTLVYYDRDEDGTIKTRNGDPLAEKQVELLPTQWLGQITKRKNPNKDIGGINNLISQVYDKYGRNLKRMATEYRGGAATQTTTTTRESERVGGSTKTSTPTEPQPSSKWDKYKSNE